MRSWPGLFVAAIILAGCMGAPAQPLRQPDQVEDGYIRIEGRVHVAGQPQAPIEGADVRLVRPDDRFYQSTTSHDGSFEIIVPILETCHIEVRKDGFRKSRFNIECFDDVNVLLGVERATTSPPREGPALTTPTGPSPSTPPATPTAAPPSRDPPASAVPRVIVAVADSGINPYHKIYHRPDLSQHPCTYVAGYPCDVPALRLSVGVYDSWQQAFDADRDTWASIKLHQWYWIPNTNIIGAVCSNPEGGGPTSVTATPSICILDDSNMHGTGTTSSVLMEAPDALLLVLESNSGAADLATAPVVPDIQSHSWGPAAPLPLHPYYMTFSPEDCASGHHHPQTLFFLAAGNEGAFPAPLDSSRFCPTSIVIGGATATSGESTSWTFYDFASWHCRPTAQTKSIDGQRARYCGTSFAAPTAAGTAAAALLKIRQAEQYLGGNEKTMVSAAVSRDQFIHALRMGATYRPNATYPSSNSIAPVPLVPGHEYLVWGWGFLDKQVVDRIVLCATTKVCPTKDPAALQWNNARHQARETIWNAGP